MPAAPDIRIGHGGCVTLWLPATLSGEPYSLTCAPTATRTRDLLLRRHFRSVPGRSWVWPDVPSSCRDNGRTWPGVARCLWSLAPSLAPRDFVSNANVRTRRNLVTRADRPGCGLGWAWLMLKKDGTRTADAHCGTWPLPSMPTRAWPQGMTSVLPASTRPGAARSASNVGPDEAARLSGTFETL